MYTKFITLFLDDLHDEEKGFLTAARYLSNEGIMEEELRQKLQGNLDWIEKHLKKRPSFPEENLSDSLSQPMSWLKENATEHIAHMDSIREILEENDILVEVLQVEHPGEIVYEDEYQVVAIPFQADEPKISASFNSIV